MRKKTILNPQKAARPIEHYTLPEIDEEFQFTTKIEELEFYLANNPHDSTIEMIIQFCEENDLDVVQAGHYIQRKPAIYAKVQSEALNNRSIKGPDKLPI